MLFPISVYFLSQFTHVWWKAKCATTRTHLMSTHVSHVPLPHLIGSHATLIGHFDSPESHLNGPVPLMHIYHFSSSDFLLEGLIDLGLINSWTIRQAVIVDPMLLCWHKCDKIYVSTLTTLTPFDPISPLMLVGVLKAKIHKSNEKLNKIKWKWK